MHDRLPEPVAPQVNAFTQRMSAVFGAPDTANSAEYKRVLNARVGKYSLQVLLRAADHFIETRKSWPKIADIITVAENTHLEATSSIRVSRNIWLEARAFAKQWHDDNTNPWLIDQANHDGWQDRLRRHVVDIAHQALQSEKPLEDIHISISNDDIEYYKSEAARYATAAIWRKENQGKFNDNKLDGAIRRVRAHKSNSAA